jgi:hypothetical protein
MKAIIRSFGCWFVNWENEFLLLYIYSYRKISFTTFEVFRKESLTQTATALYFVLTGHFLTLYKHKNTWVRGRIVFILPPLGFKPRIIQFVTSCHTEWAFESLLRQINISYLLIWRLLQSQQKSSTFSLCTHREGIWGSGVIAPHIHNIVTRRKWMVIITHLPL